MRKTIKQLEAELAAAKAEATQWKEAHRQLAEAIAKQPAWQPWWPYWYGQTAIDQTVTLPYITVTSAPPANTVFTTLTVDGVRQ